MHKADIRDLDPTRAPSVFDIDVLRVANGLRAKKDDAPA